MTGVVQEYARAREAFAAPALTLLSRSWAPVIVAVFGAAFDRDRPSMAEDEFRALLPALLGSLGATGVEVPTDTPVALCRAWVAQNFLERRANPDTGQWEYALTSHTQEVLEFVSRNSGSRALLGQSKLRTLAEIMRRAALHAATDRDTVVARYDAEIARLAAERDLVASGDAEIGVDEMALVDEFVQALATIRSLPADFARVQESYRRMARELADSFTAETRPHGEIVAEYLAASESLAESSAEGRAFAGAVELLRNEILLAQLQADTAIVLGALAGVITREERDGLAQAVPSIRSGLTRVLRQRAQATAALKQGIETYDAVAERRLADALREARLALADIVSASGLITKVPGPAQPAAAGVPTLSRQIRVDDERAVPPPLEDQPTGQTTVDAQALRVHGGPRLSDLRAAIAAAQGTVTGTQLLASLPDDMRRPVEVVGLIQLGANQLVELHESGDAPLSVYVARRPDGSIATFLAPTLEFTPEQEQS